MLLTLAAAKAPKWTRQIQRLRRTTAAVASLTHQDRMVSMTKRDRWTEEDVRALAREEPDVFERKGGRLLNDRGEFKRTLAKAISAFANSGGGSLILGIEDDGVIDGLPPNEGRTSMRDWIEQIVPNLVSYPLSDFRVHTVIPSTPTSIPEGRVVIVVDVGDSAMAPHQSAGEKIYYYRVGGRSERANHFYLELLRQRLTNPILKLKLIEFRAVEFTSIEGGVFLEAKLKFSVENEGRIAAYHWAVVPKELSHPDDGFLQENESRYIFDKSKYPVIKSRSSGIPLDSTILPGVRMNEEMDFGVVLPLGGTDASSLIAALEQHLQRLTISFQVPTETSPGEKFDLALGDYIDPVALSSKAIADRAVTAN